MEKNYTLNIPRMMEQVAESGQDCLECTKAFWTCNCQKRFLEKKKKKEEEGNLRNCVNFSTFWKYELQKWLENWTPKHIFFQQVLLSNYLPETCKLCLWPRYSLMYGLFFSCDMNSVRAELISALITAISSWSIIGRMRLKSLAKVRIGCYFCIFVCFDNDLRPHFHGWTRAAYVKMVAVNTSEHLHISKQTIR